MSAWGDPYGYDDRDEGLDLFSLGVIVVISVVLVLWGIVAAGGPS